MIGACIFMTVNETRDPMEWAHPYKTIAKFIVHSIYSSSPKVKHHKEELSTPGALH